MKKELHILLLDDDTIEHIKFNRALKSTNHKVTIAKNGSEALDLLTTLTPDLIVMDLNMPDTNGIEFLKQLNAGNNQQRIPCVVMTTTVNPRDLEEVLALGISGYFLKPLRFQDYERRINLIVDYWSEAESIPVTS
ncbi:MAG: response regulator [Flavobacteriaceae bacterium]|nr:response regulator [Flavobacteriaceae bacterium]|tara:strand:- start:153857 stop:154264 length:408 start_codon:yes stop_codon:yes gene_type:complete